MHLITRYLFKDIFRFFLIFLSIVMVLLLVYEIFDTRQVFIEGSPSLADSLRFLVYAIPGQLAQAMPMISLLATIFAYGLLAKNREILAMVAAGISFRRLAVPALIFGVLVSVGSFWFMQRIVPICEARAFYLEKVVIQGRSASIFTQNKDLFIKGADNRFYIVQEFDSTTRLMRYPTILEMYPNGQVNERIEAASARLVEGTNKTQFWELDKAERWVFDEQGGMKGYQKYASPIQVQNKDKLDLFLGKSRKADEMSFMELKYYSDLLAEKKAPEFGKFRTTMYSMVVFPLSCLLLALIGFAVVTDLHARRFAFGVFLSLIAAVLFYVAEGILQSLGKKGAMQPGLACFLPIVVFMVLAGVMIRRLDQIRA